MSPGPNTHEWLLLKALFGRFRVAVQQADALLVLGLGASAALGCYFRLIHILSQIPFHDEWHGLEAVAQKGFTEIATSFGASDYSIPITLYFETVARTIGLGELAFRAPFALVGCAGLILLPLLAYRYLGALATVIFAWFLAVSPILVFYARTARPYGITVIASVAAIFLFEGWMSRGRREYAVGYVIACVVVGWALLVHLPFALAPAVAAFVQSVASPRAKRRQLEQTALLILTVMGILAVLSGPALVNDWATLEMKSGGADFASRQLWPAAIAAFGMVDRDLVSAFLVAALIGAASLFRGHRRMVTSFAIASIALVAAVLVAQPRNAGAPMVLARYLLPLVTATLLFAAAGVARFLAWLSNLSQPLAGALAGLVLIVPLVRGPLPSILPGPDSFTTFHLFVRMHYREKQLNRMIDPPPSFYRDQFRSSWGRKDLILEAPYSGRQVVPYAFHQRFHRQRVAVGFTDGYCGESMGGQIPTAGRSGLDFRSFFWLGDLQEIRDAGVRWVVLHRQPEEETPWPDRRHLGLFDFEACVERFSKDAGQPTFLDETVAVFEIKPSL